MLEKVKRFVCKRENLVAESDFINQQIYISAQNDLFFFGAFQTHAQKLYRPRNCQFFQSTIHEEKNIAKGWTPNGPQGLGSAIAKVTA